jgi:hypothetical protein
VQVDLPTDTSSLCRINFDILPGNKLRGRVNLLFVYCLRVMVRRRFLSERVCTRGVGHWRYAVLVDRGSCRYPGDVDWGKTRGLV